MLIDWAVIIQDALQDFGRGFVAFVPQLIGALVVFLVGWAVAVGIGHLVAEILKRLKFNQIFEKEVWKHALAKAEVHVDAAGFIGAVIKWILVIVVLLIAVDILGLTGFADLLNRILAYLPNVIAAALIFVVAVIVADITEKIVRAAVESTKVGYGGTVGIIVRWSILIFAVLLILDRLLITPAFAATLFSAIVWGIVALIVISAGIAFGLGGKEVAADILQDLRKRMKKH